MDNEELKEGDICRVSLTAWPDMENQIVRIDTINHLGIVKAHKIVKDNKPGFNHQTTISLYSQQLEKVTDEEAAFYLLVHA